MANYKPAEDGLSKYFFAMLDDKDRNTRYGRAIQAAISDFSDEQGRAPRVLDVGVGTGMLSALCLEHGCEHVTGIDVNNTMVQLASTHLAKLDPRRSRHTVLFVQKGKPPFADGEMFDMLVRCARRNRGGARNSCGRGEDLTEKGRLAIVHEAL